VGKSRPAVTNALRLLKLPPEIQEELRSGRLTAGQARPLLAIAERRRQLELAGRAVEEGLTARQLEALTRSARGERLPRPKAAAAPAAPEVFAAAAAEKLTRRLQTRVEVRRAGRGGTIRIHFHSEEELIRLYDRIMERP
jgi:ParB family chromosome partitioning protein